MSFNHFKGRKETRKVLEKSETCKGCCFSLQDLKKSWTLSLFYLTSLCTLSYPHFGRIASSWTLFELTRKIKKHAKAVASLFKIWKKLNSFAGLTQFLRWVFGKFKKSKSHSDSEFLKETALCFEMTQKIQRLISATVFSEVTQPFINWMLRLLERFAAQALKKNTNWHGVKRGLL